ncbi:EamA family transporter RarD [Nocardioides daeguensis]|uniref:EamA family transporter RarD n=1 Tax=Nocardioides daeguensis TaxID=908359 RepID=A0ABP6UXM2_9ACTN|nr:EamA family transporter RarD [Nocardioides daeguensis]MBV6727014.1 EamA family transporter RarD [Nocardioides daeguensis]MCR1771583.1 EamA family transporter RarD [Nocardioides daeguensis]
MSDQRRGFTLGFLAYLMWGAFPLYWPLLRPSGAAEILAHRMVWSLVVMGVLVVVLRRTTALRAVLRDRRTTLLLVLAAATITSNWGTYIYGVNTDRVVETSLGYFINPLVTVLMGVLVLGERLRPAQWTALAIGFAAVAVLTLDYGRPPVIALVLAFSFGTYGLAKKSAGVGAIESLAFETAVIAPFALGYLLWLGSTGGAHFTSEGPGHVALLLASGVVTAVPLLCFGAAATRVSMTTLGLLQYLAPVLQFLLGITVIGERMPPGRWIGFGLVWLALAIFTVEALRHHRRQLALAAESCAV